jgi:hypothetical protein
VGSLKRLDVIFSEFATMNRGYNMALDLLGYGSLGASVAGACVAGGAVAVAGAQAAKTAPPAAMPPNFKNSRRENFFVVIFSASKLFEKI